MVFSLVFEKKIKSKICLLFSCDICTANQNLHWELVRIIQMCLISAIELTTNFSKFGIKYTQAIFSYSLNLKFYVWAIQFFFCYATDLTSYYFYIHI